MWYVYPEQFRHPDHQRRSPPGMCALPSAFLSASQKTLTVKLLKSAAASSWAVMSLHTSSLSSGAPTILSLPWKALGFWNPPSPRTWGGLLKPPRSPWRTSRRCTSCSGSSTCHNSCWFCFTTRPVCCRLFKHRAVWVDHQTEQGQTTADPPFWTYTSSDWGNRRQQASLHNPITLNIYLFQLLPSGRRCWKQGHRRTASSYTLSLCWPIYQTVNLSHLIKL